MKTNIQGGESIAAHEAYQKALTELIETEMERDRLTETSETAPARLFADAAAPMSQKPMSIHAMTDAQRNAGTTRLLALLEKRGKRFDPALLSHEGFSPKHQYVLLLGCAATLCALPTLRRQNVTTEEMASVWSMKPMDTDATRRAERRISRAARLLGRLMRSHLTQSEA